MVVNSVVHEVAVVHCFVFVFVDLGSLAVGNCGMSLALFV